MGGDFDYDAHSGGYGLVRRADPRIAAQVHAALGDARTVLNVGAGAGSYEPPDRRVIAIEPSAAMRAQRPAGAAPAVAAVAEALPLADQSVDAAMATVTVHQWLDLPRGLAELRRVTRGPIVILTADPDAVGGAWLSEYQADRVAVERRRMPPISTLAAGLAEGWGGSVDVEPVPVPLDCTDGFAEAFYGRPERMLDPVVRAAQSSWSFLAPGVEARSVAALSADLSNGAWDRRWGHLRTQPTFDGGLRLVIRRGR